MTKRDDMFAKVADAVGDLRNPFYGEERQRDVWNEASAVGFQTLLWGGMATACAMAWIGGREQVPWAIVLLIVVGVASFITLAHARANGVSGREDVRMARPRVALYLVLYVATIAGLIVRSAGSVPTGFGFGLVGGAIIGAVLGAAALIWQKRSAGQS